MSFTESPSATPQPFVAGADRCEWSADDLEHWFDGADREAALLDYDMGELHTLLLLRLIDARTSLRQHWSTRTHLLFASGLAQVLSGQAWQRIFPLPWDASHPNPEPPIAVRHLNIALAYIAILHSTDSGANRKMLAQREVGARFGIARSTTSGILTAERRRGNPCLLSDIDDAVIANGSARQTTSRVPLQGENLYPVLSLDAATSQVNPALLEVWQEAEKCDYLNTSLSDYQFTCRAFRHSPQTPFQLFGELRYFGKLAALGRHTPLWLERRIGDMVRHVLEGTPWEAAFPLWDVPPAPYRPSAARRRSDVCFAFFEYVDPIFAYLPVYYGIDRYVPEPLTAAAAKRRLADEFKVSLKTIEGYLRPKLVGALKDTQRTREK